MFCVQLYTDYLYVVVVETKICYKEIFMAFLYNFFSQSNCPIFRICSFTKLRTSSLIIIIVMSLKNIQRIKLYSKEWTCSEHIYFSLFSGKAVLWSAGIRWIRDPRQYGRAHMPRPKFRQGLRDRYLLDKGRRAHSGLQRPRR